MISKIIKRQFATAGSLLTWGQTTFGWGRPINNNYFVPDRVEGFNDVTYVVTGPCHLLFQNKDKQIFSAGLGDRGQLGNGSINDQETPQLIEGLKGINVAQLAAGTNHSLALTESGDVYAWGYAGRTGGVWNYLNIFKIDSPCGLGQTPNILTPTMIQDISGIKQIAAGHEFSLAIANNGTVYGWGQGLADIGEEFSSTPHVLDDIDFLLRKTHSNVVKMKTVNCFAMFLLENGRIYVVGRNNGGVFATRHNPRVIDDNFLLTLTQIIDDDFRGDRIIDFEVSSNSLIFRTESGAIYYSGMFRKYRPEKFPFQGEIKSMFATRDSVGVIAQDGSIKYLNDRFIENSVQRGELILCKDPLFANTIQIGGTHRLRYALISE